MTEQAAVWRRRLAGAGATLFALGMATGLWTAAALTGMVEVGMPRLALIAHLDAILGAFWMIAAAWTFEFLHYSEVGLRRLALGIALPAWSNWFVTLIASFLGVNGLSYTRDARNNVIAALLQALVVAPALVSSAFWAWGFRRKS